MSEPRTTIDNAIAPWICPSCASAVTTPFCPGCGERPIAAIDLSLKGIVAQLMRTVAGVDGRLVRSVRALLRDPGSLTQDYGDGRRKPLILAIAVGAIVVGYRFAMLLVTLATT